MIRLQSMLDACDEWMRDPDDPHKYNLNPRDYEIEVIYEVESKKPTASSKTVRKKALLSKLLRQTGKDVVEVRYRIADPRLMLVNVADAVEKQLRLLSQIQGKIKSSTDEVTTMVLVKIQQTVINELHEHPQLRKKIADAFERLQ
jgi:DNA-binding TFAR19-related protein (PDSD5 family)